MIVAALSGKQGVISDKNTNIKMKRYKTLQQKEKGERSVKLTAKQQRFCNEYLIDLNATQAAIRAGYSKKNADKTGPELLGKTEVKKYIEERQKERLKRIEITQDKVLNELAAIAFSDITDYCKVVAKRESTEGKETQVRIDLEPVLTENLTKAQKKALLMIKQGKYGIEYKLCDKIKALELLGKHLGMFTEKVELEGNMNNPFADMTTEELRQLIKSV